MYFSESNSSSIFKYIFEGSSNDFTYKHNPKGRKPLIL